MTVIFLLIFVLTPTPIYLETLNDTDEIVPDVIDIWPNKNISILYPDNKEVNFGNELVPIDLKYAPSLQWETKPYTYYTLIMVDPDAPMRTYAVVREVKHWLVVNILVSNVTSGEVIADYVGAGPPKDTGFHRYIFLVYEQPKKLKFDEPKSSKMSSDHRLKFSSRKFAENYHFGNPIAINFFIAQWDPYVDFRNKQIQINI